MTAHLIRKHPNLVPRFSPAPDQGRQRVRESSASATFSSPVIRSSSASLSVSRFLLHVSTESNRTPNHALQRTPGFGVQLPGAALIRPAQSRAVLPAMKPGTARAFALRRRAHSRAPGPESLSLGSLGAFAHPPGKPTSASPHFRCPFPPTSRPPPPPQSNTRH